jgi:hypothetical protein
MYCGTAHRSARASEMIAAAMAAQTRGSDRPSWHEFGEDAARIPMTEDAVLDLLRLHFSDCEAVSVCPHVPPKKEHAARCAHVVHLPPRERVLALYGTLLGDGHDGFVVTAKRICWKNLGEPACSIKWTELDAESLDLDGHRLFIGDDTLAIVEEEILEACAKAFHVLAVSAVRPQPTASGPVLARDTQPAPFPRVSRPVPTGTTEATPPPPHTTSYFAYASHAQAQAPDCSCWHCHTPLYETTPQCAFCGAVPDATGWLRTG